MSPSELLIRAADLIRDTAAAATPGPWIVDDPAYAEAIYTLDGYEDVVSGGRWGGEASVFSETADARWIALMSPAVAPAIEAMLRAAAHDVKISSMVLNARQFEAALRDRYESALALARAVLGEKEEQ